MRKHFQPGEGPSLVIGAFSVIVKTDCLQFYSCDTQGQELTRDKFARLMCSSAKSHRRDYDIGDEGEAEHGH